MALPRYFPEEVLNLDEKRFLITSSSMSWQRRSR